MTENSPFSGGGGVQTPQDPNRPIPQNVQDLIELLNSRATQKYLIDPDGIKMEISFTTTGICTIKSGDTSLTFPFKKI